MKIHESLMSELAHRHDVLLPLIVGRKVHYLDVPMYGNIGDLLIMSGTLEFFKKHQINVTRYGMYFNYRTDWATEDDVIVFQGGGNFGDIYGPFQKFREHVIAVCPNNRIIILPQSIHFNDPINLEECTRLFARHRDLHICVRDSISADLAGKMSKNIYLLPDMAHQLWPISRTAPDTKPVLKLRRRDSETDSAVNSSGYAFDWNDLVGKHWIFFLSQIAERCMYHATRFGLNRPFSNLETLIWIKQANRFVQSAIHLFSQHQSVESDRLHAHILACLLSLPNRIGDNAYGKNSRYINQWTKSSELVQIEKNADLFIESN